MPMHRWPAVTRMSDEKLWTAVERLTKAVGCLWEFSLKQAPDAGSLAPLQDCLAQYQSLLSLLNDQMGAADAPSADELHERLCGLEDRERALAEDRARPVEIIIQQTAQ